MSERLEDKLKGLRCIAIVGSDNRPHYRTTAPHIVETYQDTTPYCLEEPYSPAKTN